MHGQFRMSHEGGRAVSYVTWANLSEEVEQAYMANPLNLQPKDWNSGEITWIIDFIAPFGHIWPVVHDLRNNVFQKGQVGKALRVKVDSDVARIFKLLAKRK